MPLHVSSTCAHHQRSKLHYTTSGIITPIGGRLVHETATYRCDDNRYCVMQFWPPDDEHMCSKHVEAWNKFIVKQKFFASSWLITEINILRYTVRIIIVASSWLFILLYQWCTVTQTSNTYITLLPVPLLKYLTFRSHSLLWFGMNQTSVPGYWHVVFTTVHIDKWLYNNLHFRCWFRCGKQGRQRLNRKYNLLFSRLNYLFGI